MIERRHRFSAEAKLTFADGRHERTDLWDISIWKLFERIMYEVLRNVLACRLARIWVLPNCTKKSKLSRTNMGAQFICTVRFTVVWSRHFYLISKLILECIDADFCDQGLILQRFSSFTCFKLSFLFTSPEFGEFSKHLHRFLVNKSQSVKHRKKMAKLP